MKILKWFFKKKKDDDKYIYVYRCKNTGEFRCIGIDDSNTVLYNINTIFKQGDKINTTVLKTGFIYSHKVKINKNESTNL